MANPQAGSRNRVEYALKLPATGKRTAISPSFFDLLVDVACSGRKTHGLNSTEHENADYRKSNNK